MKDRLVLSNWKVPLDYGGDNVLILGWLQASADGDFAPFHDCSIQRLGAPYSANWNDYPMYEKILIFGLGQLSRLIGVVPACNLGCLLSYATSAMSFFLCAMFMRFRKEWAFAGALLFAFTYYNEFSIPVHLFLSFSYTLPFAMLGCWLILFGKQMRWFDKSCWVCLASSFVIGYSNPYNLCMYFQFLIFAIFLRLFLRPRKISWQIGLCCMGIAMFAFLATNLNTILFILQHGKNAEGLYRHYIEAELYSLKPMELLIPPETHNWDLFVKIGEWYRSQAFVRGEVFSPYLGMVVIGGLVWVVAESLRVVLRLGRRIEVPAYGLQCLWVLFFAMLGGINCLLGLAGILYFRGSNRYSIFISTFVLLFLTSRFSVLSRRWNRLTSYCAAGLMLTLGLTDQLQRRTQPEETAAVARRAVDDQHFGATMEARLPHAAMVFQLPLMLFPEALPLGQLTGYEMFAPYFNSKNLRFSFGSVRGRTREEWQWEVEKMPAPQMIDRLEKYGFSAIYINRLGYEDHGEALVKKLAAAGRDQTFEDENHTVICVLLKPSPTPELPHTDDRAQFLLGGGWGIKDSSPLENRAWSTGDAVVKFFSEPKLPTAYNLRCVLGTIDNRHVSMDMDGREIWSGQLSAGQGAQVDITVTGKHGNNTIHLRTDAPPSSVKETPLPLAFTLVNLRITKVGSPD